MNQLDWCGGCQVKAVVNSHGFCKHCDKLYRTPPVAFGSVAPSYFTPSPIDPISYRKVIGKNLWEGELPNVKPQPVEPENQYAGAVRLWRLWRISNSTAPDLKLVPLTPQGNYTWKAGENHAILDPANKAAASGFHGFSSIEEMMRQETELYDHAVMYATSTIAGSILCYGRIKVGTKGARVEYAVPEYMILEKDGSGWHHPYIKKLAVDYGMRIITEEQAMGLKTGLVPYRKPVSLDDILEGK